MKCLAQNASLPTDRDLVVNYFWSMTPKVVQRATFRPRAMGHAFFDTNKTCLSINKFSVQTWCFFLGSMVSVMH